MRKIPNGSASFALRDFSPFSNLNNEEFIHTLKGKKIKFTHVVGK